MKLSAECKICGMQSDFFDEARLIQKHIVKYFRCLTCGFIQTETPYWLEEAYSSAIAKQDVGIISRNLQNLEITTSVLNLLYPEVKTSLDFGGGHGIFVRLMRDKGFDFVWYDPHASNDYARGFESDDQKTYDFLTAFEVLEHLVDPLGELDVMMRFARNVFISTTLLPEPAPKILDWWYYVPSSGQHVSLFTLKALQLLAHKFERNLLSYGSYHLFTVMPNNIRSRMAFRLATNVRASLVINKVCKRTSLVETDFQLMVK